MKTKGHIEFFNPSRGFGFVIDAEEPRTERFFHFTNVVAGTPLTGRLCVYETGATLKGPVALDIEVVVGGRQ
jgi:cold shock CspA family protein